MAVPFLNARAGRELYPVEFCLLRYYVRTFLSTYYQLNDTKRSHLRQFSFNNRFLEKVRKFSSAKQLKLMSKKYFLLQWNLRKSSFQTRFQNNYIVQKFCKWLLSILEYLPFFKLGELLFVGLVIAETPQVNFCHFQFAKFHVMELRACSSSGPMYLLWGGFRLNINNRKTPKCIS